MLGVDGILRRVGAEKTDRRFRVFKRSGETDFSGQTVGDGRGDVPVLGQFHGQRNIAFLRARAKPPPCTSKTADEALRMPRAGERYPSSGGPPTAEYGTSRSATTVSGIGGGVCGQ